MLLLVKPGATPLTRMLLAESWTEAAATSPCSAVFAIAVDKGQQVCGHNWERRPYHKGDPSRNQGTRHRIL